MNEENNTQETKLEVEIKIVKGFPMDKSVHVIEF